jgi:(E)-4-hydroxy-3-methylbut-2-enyl-diphosphate synthase
MTVGLGLPAMPAPVLASRRVTRQLRVGSVGVGSESPISVQSMTTTVTSDVNATLQQIAELTAAGCDIVRVACPSADDAEALPAIAAKSQIPVIADIHFQPRYVFAAIEAGCAAVRVNPGNIRKFDDQVKEIAQAATDHGTPIRIGVNAGSLDKRLMEKHGKATPEALAESALWEAGLFAEHGFHDIKISVKHNDPVVMVRAYELLAEQCDYPLHLGVTEAGPAFQGTIKSAVAFGALLRQGIGDTIRVSLSAPPVEEVKVGAQILQSLNLRPRKLEIVPSPNTRSWKPSSKKPCASPTTPTPPTAQAANPSSQWVSSVAKARLARCCRYPWCTTIDRRGEVSHEYRFRGFHAGLGLPARHVAGVAGPGGLARGVDR